MKNFFILLFAGLFLASCDIVKPPRKIIIPPSSSDNVILLEEYTGHFCSGCPLAHAKGEELKGIYGDNLVILSIHAGPFANQWPGGFDADFTSAAGDELDAYFDVTTGVLPIGMINRKPFDGQILQEWGDWSSYVDQAMKEPVEALIDITTEYDSSSRTVNIAVSVEYFLDGTQDDYLMLYLTEDSIISQQKMPDGSAEPNYVQMHMLRDAITSSAWGEALNNGKIFAGQTFDYNTTYTLDTKYDAKYCHIIAVVGNNETKEVIQAAEEKLQ